MCFYEMHTFKRAGTVSHIDPISQIAPHMQRRIIDFHFVIAKIKSNSFTVWGMLPQNITTKKFIFSK